MTERWHELGAAPLPAGTTAAVFVTNDEALRATLEQTVVEHLPNVSASYRVMPDVEGETSALVKRVRAEGFTHAIIMRVGDNRMRTTYYTMDAVTDRIVTVETMIFALESERMTFAARTEVANPSDTRMLVETVMRRITPTLTRDGLLNAQPEGSGKGIAALVDR